MRRVLKLLGICLSLGFALNLLVAWISGFVWPLTFIPPFNVPATPWQTPPPPQWPSSPTEERWMFTILWDLHVQEHSLDDVEGETPPEVKAHVLSHNLYGVPMRCLCATNAHIFASDKTRTEIGLPRIQRGISFSHVQGSPKTIALNPIPAGLAINTACWAAFVLAVRAAVLRLQSLRRRRRARHGLCTRCKYPVRDLTACPECGTVVEPPREHRQHA